MKSIVNLTAYLRHILVILVALLSPLVVYGEVFELVGYPKQGAALETLRSGLFNSHREISAWTKMSPLYRTFYQRRSSGSVQVLPNHPKLNYNLWMQDKKADLVVIVPGIGTNYADIMPTALAQLCYQAGYSVVVISNAMNWEFMGAAGRNKIPGFPPNDAADVKHALQLIIKQLNRDYPGKIGERLLVGYSLGALHALFIAATEDNRQRSLFMRYLAINPPVDLIYAMKVIDSYYLIGNRWSKAEMQRRLKRAVNIYMALITGQLNKNQPIQLTSNEAKYMIGVSFQMILGDTIFSIYRRYHLGVIKTPYSWYDRRKIYAEIGTFTYKRYIQSYLLPFYDKKFGKHESLQQLNRQGSLTAIAEQLKNNQAVRVIHNINDFLLRPQDIQLLRSIFGKRLVLFSAGGHLGNFYRPEVQQQIIKMLR